MTSKRGFTLLELTVASAIMALAVVGLLSGLSAAARNAARLRDHDRMVQLAQLRMNDLLLDNQFPRDTEMNGEFEPSLSGGLKAGWRARLATFEMPPNIAPGQMALDRFQLEIWWMAGPDRRTLQLEGYRRRVLGPQDISPVAVTP